MRTVILPILGLSLSGCLSIASGELILPFEDMPDHVERDRVWREVLELERKCLAGSVEACVEGSRKNLANVGRGSFGYQYEPATRLGERHPDEPFFFTNEACSLGNDASCQIVSRCESGQLPRYECRKFH